MASRAYTPFTVHFVKAEEFVEIKQEYNKNWFSQLTQTQVQTQFLFTVKTAFSEA